MEPTEAEANSSSPDTGGSDLGKGGNGSNYASPASQATAVTPASYQNEDDTTHYATVATSASHETEDDTTHNAAAVTSASHISEDDAKRNAATVTSASHETEGNTKHNVSEAVRQQPAPTTSKPDPPPQRERPETTVEMLERLSAAGAMALNNQDHDFSASPETRELRSRMMPSWRGQIDTYAHAKEVTFAEQSAMWAQRRAEYPDVFFEIVSISTVIDERKGEALVFIDMEVSGLATFKLQAMSELTWRKVKGKWMLAHTVALRGTRGNSGGFG
jgi:hypothetical protein